MVIPTPRCDAVVDVFSPTHCWAGGLSPADVTHPTASRGRWRCWVVGVVVGVSVVGG